MLTGVSAVWNAEADLKVKGFEQQVSEKMPLDQTEAVQRLAPHCELQPDRQENTCDNSRHYATAITFDGQRHIKSKPSHKHVRRKRRRRRLQI